ncbi:AraC family transcriptional regulator [Psychromarinibacter sp. C21-152]|uniref:AraC family transcriptional regulator n=1 Tax=Psychromarinibacter sediminicola TaxID=3033385 RepID=A0AAE3T7C4_9RHOB|nr:AraC family transcriptional regulator [Psychromarinibacter sediminicola]MDF0600172.1 AraC family transcriptional regulator [Psychromarinibacter sediminicola]
MTQPDLAPLIGDALALWRRHGGSCPIPGLSLTVTEAPMGPIHVVYRPSMCIVLQGAKISHLGETAYRYGAGNCLITSMDVPIRADIVGATPDAPYIAAVVTLDPATIADLLLELPADAPAAPPEPAALSVHPLSADLLDPLSRLMALAVRPRDIPVLAPMIRREIVWQLLNGPQGGVLRQIGLTDSRTARIGRAIAWVRENFARTLSVPHLAALAGMSPATFHRHFKAATAMTPVQFQKSLRLQEARRLLLADGSDVAQVGFAIGYESPSQFSREYRRMFGAPPGRDGAQIRRAVVSETPA